MVAEIIDGKLHTLPRPSPLHAIAYSRLGGKINRSFDFGCGGNGPGGWWIINEPELHLGKDILVPDIAGWRQARMPKAPKTAFFSLAPDWVCEVLSPSTRKIDLLHKKPIYTREAVSHLWFVDPDAQTFEAFVLCDGNWALIDQLFGHATVSLPPFEAISFNLGDLWIDDEWDSKTVHKATSGSDLAASP